MSWIHSVLGSRISQLILFTIVVLAVVIFIAVALHRFLANQIPAQPQNMPEMSSSGAFRRQLQQLFRLQDSGLDQSHIDALPVFLYKEIIGLKEPFNCAVCLSEFSEVDKLKLLPHCRHAFHIDCIDTWLLSNSNCPLCRGMILSTEFDDSKEMGEGNGGFESSSVSDWKRVFSVRLGVVNQENECSSSSSSSLDGRRCYSMGSFQYVVADSELQVALCPSGRQHGVGGQNWNFIGEGDGEVGKKFDSRAKGESFSVSKIWLWSKKGKFPTSNYSNATLP